MDVDTIGKGTGGKRVANLVDKLSAGGTASEVEIKRTLDELLDTSGAWRGWSGQVTYESLSLLCDGAGVVGGAAFVESEEFVERLSLRLQQDLPALLKTDQTNNAAAKNSDARADLERSAVQLVSRLPDETLCKLLGMREATRALQGVVFDHSVASLRAFSITRLTAACTRCWSFLDRRAFVNGAFDQGADAQRFKQRVRDWIHDFFSGLVNLCDDLSDAVAAAAFDAIHATLSGHPLCVTWVDDELREFWGQGERWRGRPGIGDRMSSDVDFGAHKQAFPLQHLGEIVLRSALPRIRRLLRRQARMLPAHRTVTGEAAIMAIRACTLLLVSALRLSTSPSGKPVRHPLLESPASADFLGTNGGVGVGEEADGVGVGGGVGKGTTPGELAREWVGMRLRAVMEDAEGRDASLVEAAAWAVLRVVGSAALSPLKASTAPRAAEAFLRVLMVGQTSIPRGSWSSLHAGQQETAAGAAMALLISSPSATAALAPHIFAAAERVPQPRRRLSLLADVFFVLLVRAARGGRAPRASNSSGGNGGVSRGSGVSGKGWGFQRRRMGRNGGRAETGERSRGLLVVSVLEEDWFVELVSEPPAGARRLVFREETVAALATACAQVLSAGSLSVLSASSHKAAAVGIGTLAAGFSGKVNNNHKQLDEVGRWRQPAEAAAVEQQHDEEGEGAERSRWSDLEAWLDCSLSTLESCTRCVNWKSEAGYIAGIAYVRLFSLALRLLCPVAAVSGGKVVGLEGIDITCGGGGAAGSMKMGLDGFGKGGGRGGRLRWARERLAQVMDDLMWRLREGLPGRDIRLRLLQATCTHVRLLAVVGGNDRLAEDAAVELVSVLQGELGELDAQAGLTSQQQLQAARAPLATVGGEDSAGASATGSNEATVATTVFNSAAAAAILDAGADVVTDAGSDVTGSVTGGDVAPPRAAATPVAMAPARGFPSSESASSKRESMTDVAAHEVVVGCLVRLALVARGETASEVLSVLERERGRARARERLGRGAVGPMEEAVTKGMAAVELLAIRRDASASRTALALEASLLKRFLATMDLGWQAAAQPDERALTGNQAGIFDHAVHASPHLQRRLRRRLCSGVGGNSSPSPSIADAFDNDFSCSPASWKMDAPDRTEEAPHFQLNGGSDPVVVTATHVVEHGTSQGRRGRCAGATLRLSVFNATNARLQGFSIRLSFGQGGEAGGMASAGGRVETFVNEVLMPSAAHALEVPIAPLDVLQDVVVHVTVVFPDAEAEPDFESEGTTELLGIEAKGTSHFGSTSQLENSGGSLGGEEGGSSVSVTLHVGSYRLPAEVFLGPPKPFNTTWAGFQTVWSGLPYAHTFPVESLGCRRRWAGSSEEDGKGLRSFGALDLGRHACDDLRAPAAATVACPRGNTDFAMSEAWALEAWDGTPVLISLTVMKAPFAFTFSFGGDGGWEKTPWFGRMEMRCASHACLEFARTSSERLARFVTGGVFFPRNTAEALQQHVDAFGGAFPSTAVGGGEHGVRCGGDLFSRTDTSVPEPPAGLSSGALLRSSSSLFVEDVAATGSSKLMPLVRALRENGFVDTTQMKR